MKRVLIVIGVLLVVAIGFIAYVALTTKSHSPEDNVNFADGELKVHVFYNRPSKKGRIIFAKDGLVPYGKVWRTGANEATVFETNKDLSFGGQTLAAGKYSLWTIPNETSWSIIFNNEIPSWGVGFDGQAQRNPANDVLKVESPVVLQEKEFEQFTINVEKAGEEMELLFIWDKTLVATPFSRK
ncbi:MAG: DUF2911 domain-containing protein [Bacteroidetes bacterium]|nr:DUF2911 domain-containing protein [Bacteroidota bacterium]